MGGGSKIRKLEKLFMDTPLLQKFQKVMVHMLTKGSNSTSGNFFKRVKSFTPYLTMCTVVAIGKQK